VREHGAYPIAERTVPEYRWPSEASKTPRTCWNCGSNLLYGDVPIARYDEVDIECWNCSRLQCELTSDLTPRRLTPDEWRALPANQPKIGRPKNQTETAPKRLVRILEQADHPMPSLALAALLGTSENAARNAIAAARYAGAKIAWTKLGYVLEGVTS
jgi:biotin operon repressor